MFRAGASGINAKATIQLRAGKKSRWQICLIICIWFRQQDSSLRLNFPPAAQVRLCRSREV